MPKKLKIGINLDHAESLAAYQAAGHGYPAIPTGKNSVWYHFTTTDGRCAVILNQTGFAPQASDNEEQINGCMLAVMLDSVPDPIARQSLEDWIRTELTNNP
jgi:hypothetical protein